MLRTSTFRPTASRSAHSTGAPSGSRGEHSAAGDRGRRWARRASGGAHRRGSAAESSGASREARNDDDGLGPFGLHKASCGAQWSARSQWRAVWELRVFHKHLLCLPRAMPRAEPVLKKTPSESPPEWALGLGRCSEKGTGGTEPQRSASC